MNSSYINAVVAAFLTVAFVVMTVSIVSESIFHVGGPEVEGYSIAVTEGSATAVAEAADAGITPIAPLLVSANVDAGMRAFRKCQACHTVDDGGADRVGPNLYDIVDRPVAAAVGFGYSGAMTDYAEGGAKAWDYDALNNFLHSPRNYIRGTSMGFAGLKRDAERADVIAYLRSLSANPVPLPSPDAAPAEEAEAQPASAETEAAPAADETSTQSGTSDSTESSASESTESTGETEAGTGSEDAPASDDAASGASDSTDGTSGEENASEDGDSTSTSE